MTGELLKELRHDDMKRYVKRHGFWPDDKYYKSLAKLLKNSDSYKKGYPPFTTA